MPIHALLLLSALLLGFFAGYAVRSFVSYQRRRSFDNYR
jgi:hypothetical protein